MVKCSNFCKLSSTSLNPSICLSNFFGLHVNLGNRLLITGYDIFFNLHHHHYFACIMNKTEQRQTTGHQTESFIISNDRQISFNDDWDTGIGGGLWSTGLAMSKYFASHVSQIQSDLQSLQFITKKQDVGLSAIELGSGNSFLSAVFAPVSVGIVSELVVTDLADHLELMEKTFAVNQTSLDWQKQKIEKSENQTFDIVQCAGTLMNGKMKLVVAEHSWGKFAALPACIDKKFDFIFGSDVAYHGYQPLLIQSLLRLSHNDTVILIGCTMYDSKPQFFRDLIKAGFRYERLKDNLVESQFRGTTFGIFVIQRLSTTHSK